MNSDLELFQITKSKNNSFKFESAPRDTSYGLQTRESLFVTKHTELHTDTQIHTLTYTETNNRQSSNTFILCSITFSDSNAVS